MSKLKMSLFQFTADNIFVYNFKSQLFTKLTMQSGILTRKLVIINKQKKYFEKMEGFLGLRKYIYFFCKSIVSNMKRPLLYYYYH